LQLRHAPIVVALAVLALWPAPQGLFELWMDSDRPYSHGLLVAPIAAFLVWRASQAQGRLPAEPSVTALVLFVGATAVWLLGLAADVLVVQQILFPPLLLLGAASVFGWRAACALLFPVGFLFFAIPVWSYLVPLLQEMTVVAVRVALDSFAIPVLAEGNLITIPEGTFEIAGGCAGLHYFVVALVIASLYGYLNAERFSTRLAIVAAGAALAILTNWVRVGSLVVIGHETDMQHYLIAEDHYYYGWLLFGIALVPFFVIARRVATSSEPATAVVERMSQVDSKARPRPIVVALFICALAIPVLVVQSRGASDGSSSAIGVELPGGSGIWSGPRSARSAWEPRFAGADGVALADYESGSETVTAFVAVYLTQGQGRELIGEDNRFAEGSEVWGLARRRTVAGPGAGSVGERIFTTSPNGNRLVWYWYVVGSTATASEAEAKIRHVLRGLLGRESGAVVALSVDCGRECTDRHRATLDAFAIEMAPQLEAVAAASQSGS
jgi:exosortase A